MPGNVPPAINFPVYLHIGSWTIHPHWFFETLSYAVAFSIYLRLRQRRGDNLGEVERWWVIAAAAAGALVGSRVLYWFEDPQLTIRNFRDVNYLMGGKTIVGALAGGLLCVELMKFHMGIRRPTGDLFAIPLCVGIGIGRMGCFFTGLADHTFGTPTSMPWGVNFGDGLMRHPTQLYETGFVWLLGIILWRHSRGTYKSGDLFKIFMVAYFGFRLACDFLKPEVRVFGGLSAIQWACCCILIYYATDVFRWMRFLGPAAASEQKMGETGARRS